MWEECSSFWAGKEHEEDSVYVDISIAYIDISIWQYPLPYYQWAAVKARGGKPGAEGQPEVVSRIPEWGRMKVWSREVEMWTGVKGQTGEIKGKVPGYGHNWGLRSGDTFFRHHSEKRRWARPELVRSGSQPSVQFSSVAQSCPTLCDPINHSMPGLPVHHQLPEFTQTHVHPTISSSRPLLASESFQLSQLFASGGQSIGVSATTSVLPINTHDWSPLGWTGWIPQSKGLSRVFSNTTVQKHQFFSTQLSL